MTETGSVGTMRLLTVSAVSKRLQVSDRSVRRWIASGRIRVVRLGRLVRIPETEVDALAASGLPKAE